MDGKILKTAIVAAGMKNGDVANAVRDLTRGQILMTERDLTLICTNRVGLLPEQEEAIWQVVRNRAGHVLAQAHAWCFKKSNGAVHGRPHAAGEDV